MFKRIFVCFDYASVASYHASKVKYSNLQNIFNQRTVNVQMLYIL